MSKLRPLIVLWAVVFAGEVIEGAAWRARGNHLFEVIQSLLMAIAIYWWYHLDKVERQFRAGVLQNIGVAAVSPIALPVYFVRSRGWRRGAWATLGALGIFLLMIAFAMAGYILGRQVAF
jgi:hypothetical protein